MQLEIINDFQADTELITFQSRNATTIDLDLRTSNPHVGLWAMDKVLHLEPVQLITSRRERVPIQFLGPALNGT